MLTHARDGLVNAEAHRDRYVFFETPKGKRVKAGLKRAAREAAKVRSGRQCSMCSGTGRVEVGAGFCGTRSTVCSRCNGKGKVMK
jgi:DnaJ-class molecular chaperone